MAMAEARGTWYESITTELLISAPCLLWMQWIPLALSWYLIVIGGFDASKISSSFGTFKRQHSITSAQLYVIYKITGNQSLSFSKPKITNITAKFFKSTYICYKS